MAEKVKVTLEFDGKNVALLNQTANDMKKVEGQTAKTSAGFERFNAIAIAAYAAVAAAATKFVSGSLAEFAKFEKGMSDVSTLLGNTGEDTKKMGAEVLNLAKKTPIAIGNLTSALYDVRSAGISAADAMGVLESGARLGVTGLATTKEATGALALALNVFGDEAHDANRIADLMFKTVKYGVTTISDIAAGFGEVASIAKESNISIEELQAATAAMTVTNKSAALSQTSLRAAITSIIAPSDAMQKVIKKAGYETGEAMLKQLGLVGSMNALKQATGNNINVLKEVYGRIEGLKAQLVLTGTQADTFKRVMQSMTGTANDLNLAYDKQLNTMDSILKVYKNKLTAEQIKFGEAIAYTIRWLIKYNAMVEKVKTSVISWVDAQAQGIFNLMGLVDKQGQQAEAFVNKQLELRNRDLADIQQVNEKIVESNNSKVTQIDAEEYAYYLKTKQQLQENFDKKMQLILKEKLEMQKHWTFMLLGAQLNAEQRKAIDDSLADSFAALGTLMNSTNRKVFEIGKAASIAQVTVNTVMGAINAVTSTAALGPLGWVLGGIKATAITAAGALAVSQIAGTQMPAAAMGGLTTGPTIAGEAGTEGIVPLEGEGLRRVQQAVGVTGGGPTINLNIQNFFADDERLPRRVAETIDKELEDLRRLKASTFAVGLEQEIATA